MRGNEWKSLSLSTLPPCLVLLSRLEYQTTGSLASRERRNLSCAKILLLRSTDFLSTWTLEYSSSRNLGSGF